MRSLLLTLLALPLALARPAPTPTTNSRDAPSRVLDARAVSTSAGISTQTALPTFPAPAAGTCQLILKQWRATTQDPNLISKSHAQIVVQGGTVIGDLTNIDSAGMSVGSALPWTVDLVFSDVYGVTDDRSHQGSGDVDFRYAELGPLLVGWVSDPANAGGEWFWDGDSGFFTRDGTVEWQRDECQ